MGACALQNVASLYPSKHFVKRLPGVSSIHFPGVASRLPPERKTAGYRWSGRAVMLTRELLRR
jgi:hypothetical protein